MKSVVASMLVLLAWAAPCAAEPQRVHLRWSAPAGSMCPNGPTLSADVEALTGRPFVSDPAEADVIVVGRIERSELEVVAHIEAHAADGTPVGTRELRAPGEECAALRRPLAMVLALLLDEPGAVMVRRSSSVRLSAGPELVVDSHVMPRAAGGVGLLAVLSPAPWLSLRAHATYFWPLVAETAEGVGARLQAVAGGLSFCPRLVGKRSALWVCGSARGGAVIATPRGLDSTAVRAMAFADASVDLTASWAFARRAALWAGVGPTFALTRPELYFGRGEEMRTRIHRATPVAAIFRVGLTIGGP